MPLLIAALLALSAALVVLYPLLGLVREPAAQVAPSVPTSDAAERERLARQALREVEFDYTLGNLATGDYEELRERYETRALAALKTRYQREQELDALIERQLDALRQSESSPMPTAARPAATARAASAVKPALTTRRPTTGSVRDRRASKRKGS
jgi:hypothetical protein